MNESAGTTRPSSLIEFVANWQIDVTECRWPDGFMALLPGAAMAEDPTFRDELVAMAERARGRWEAERVG